jgi:hypothetical protein
MGHLFSGLNFSTVLLSIFTIQLLPYIGESIVDPDQVDPVQVDP